MRAQESNQRILPAEVCGVAVIGEQLDSVFFKDRFFFRQASGLFILTGQLARDNLAGFDVWLIEGIDANDGTGYGGGDFPAEELLANVINVIYINAHDRLSCSTQDFNLYVLIWVRSVPEPQINKDAVIAIDFRPVQLFPVNRNQAFALFAGAFGKQLLQPRAQVPDSR